MARRRQAVGGRPLLRQGGGKWLGWILPRCCEELGASRGELVHALSQKLGTTRDRIYRVIRGDLGMAPDAMWQMGCALYELDILWMSSPLALALEPRYDAHLLGVVGEVVLEPMHFLWRGDLQDFLWHRAELRDPSEHAFKCIKAYAFFNSEMRSLFELAWQRWYATNASELATKERESRFADKAPALARAVSLLRAHQRSEDSGSFGDSYGLLLHDLNKDIREYFEIGGYEGRPLYARPKYAIEQQPRFSLLSNDQFGQTEFGRRLQALISPGDKPVSPSEAYRSGWDLRVPESSGLLALALFDYEREFYLLVAQIAKDIFPALEREKAGEQWTGDVERLRRYKTWWKSLWAIACLMGPLDEGLVFISKELAYVLEGNFKPVLADNRWPDVRWRISDLHAALFEESKIAAHLRSMITLPTSVAIELSAYTVSSAYNPADYETSTTPKALVTVLGMLHNDQFGYPTGTTRIELFWWFRDVAQQLDAVV